MRPRFASTVLVAAALVSLSCTRGLRQVGVPDPISRPPNAAGSPDEVFGFQAEVRTEGERYFGELVACDETNVYLFVNGAGGPGESPWRHVPWAFVQHAHVRTPGSGKAVTIAVTAIGSASAISHGLFTIISMPVWAVVGGPSIGWSFAAEQVSGHCADLHAYSRYPQGLPPTMAWHYFPAPPPPVAPPVPAAPPTPAVPVPAAPPAPAQP